MTDEKNIVATKQEIAREQAKESTREIAEKIVDEYSTDFSEFPDYEKYMAKSKHSPIEKARYLLFCEEKKNEIINHVKQMIRLSVQTEVNLCEMGNNPSATKDVKKLAEKIFKVLQIDDEITE